MRAARDSTRYTACVSSHRSAQVESRFTLWSTPVVASAGFAEDIRVGLTRKTKQIAPCYLYDSLGSHLFEAICELPEYYPTRAECEILSTHVGAIVDAVLGDSNEPLRLIELGSGSSVKTKWIIEALLERQESLEYLPIDVSGTALENAAGSLLEEYAGLSIRAFECDYDTALSDLAAGEPHRNLVLFLGSSIGNLDTEHAIDLLREIRPLLADGGALLLGTDLDKSSEILVPAYDDAIGVTAAFNKNLLARINRELGGHFDPRSFRHVALYDRTLKRIEMHLESREAQTVRIDDLDLDVPFDVGERIFTESSHKYDAGLIDEITRQSKLACRVHWTDASQLFRENLLTITS